MPDSPPPIPAANPASELDVLGAAAAAITSFCIGCGYELRGITSPRCPECGLAIDPTAAASEVPWAHRRQLGRAVAFFRTLVLASFRPRRLAAAVAGPVDAAASRQFRWIVNLLVGIPLAAVLIVLVWRSGGVGEFNFLGNRLFDNSPLYTGGAGAISCFAWEVGFLWIAGATLWPVFPLAIVCLFPLMTLAAGPWMRAGRLPTELQNRAFAIAGYTAAPLLWLWLPIAAFGAILALQSPAAPFDPNDWAQPLLLVRLATIICLLLWYVVTLRVMALVTHCGFARLLAAAVLVPISWLFAAILALVGLPVIAGLICLIIDSLR